MSPMKMLVTKTGVTGGEVQNRKLTIGLGHHIKRRKSYG